MLIQIIWHNQIYLLMQVKSFAYIWMHVCLPYLICAICVYERILLYNICTYLYNLHTRIHTYATLLFLLRRYSYPVERRALILMSISGPGLATVLRRDSRKHNEKCHGTSGARRPAGRSGLTSPRQLISRMHRHL